MVLGCNHVGNRALTPALREESPSALNHEPESPPTLSAYSHCSVLLLIILIMQHNYANYANFAPEEHKVPIASSGQFERAITQPAYPCLLNICCALDSILCC